MKTRFRVKRGAFRLRKQSDGRSLSLVTELFEGKMRVVRVRQHFLSRTLSNKDEPTVDCESSTSVQLIVSADRDGPAGNTPTTYVISYPGICEVQHSFWQHQGADSTAGW